MISGKVILVSNYVEDIVFLSRVGGELADPIWVGMVFIARAEGCVAGEKHSMVSIIFKAHLGHEITRMMSDNLD